MSQIKDLHQKVKKKVDLINKGSKVSLLMNHFE